MKTSTRRIADWFRGQTVRELGRETVRRDMHRVRPLISQLTFGETRQRWCREVRRRMSCVTASLAK